MISYACPRCARTLLNEGEMLRCPHDGYTNAPVDGIRDFLLPEEEARHASFIAEYRALRSREGRGSDDPGHYLSLPDIPSDLPKRTAWSMQEEWRARKESALWLHDQLERWSVSSGTAGRRKILDAGAGNCWLTRRLAEWGNEAVALDLNIDPYDGLAAGRHYLASLPITFERVRADFAHLPFPDRELDAVVFNGSFHYADDRMLLVEEARRVIGVGGAIFIIDSPFYHDRASGEKMLAEHGGMGRAGFITFDEMHDLARRAGLELELHHPHMGRLLRMKRRFTEMRLGREIVTTTRVRMRKGG